MNVNVNYKQVAYTTFFLLFLMPYIHAADQSYKYKSPDNKSIQEELINLLHGSLKEEQGYKKESSSKEKLKMIKDDFKKQAPILSLKKQIKGYNLMHFIAEKNDTDLYKQIINLEHCKNFFVKKDNEGWAPIHYASFYNHAKILSMLLAIPEISVNLRTTREKALPWHLAASQNAVKVLKVFYDYKVKKFPYNEIKTKKLSIKKKDNFNHTASDYYEALDVDKDEAISLFLCGKTSSKKKPTKPGVSNKSQFNEKKTSNDEKKLQKSHRNEDVQQIPRGGKYARVSFWGRVFNFNNLFMIVLVVCVALPVHYYFAR